MSYHFLAYVLDPSQLTSKSLTLNILAGGNSKCNWGTDIGVLMQQATALGHTGEKEKMLGQRSTDSSWLRAGTQHQLQQHRQYNPGKNEAFLFT